MALRLPVRPATPGVLLRACLRCHGDLTERRDIHGTYWACLQCGEIAAEQYSIRLRRPA